MNEIDAVVQILIKKCNKILIRKKLTPKQKLGNIGEIFVRYGLKQSFWNRGYKVEEQGINTFTIERQYRAYEGKKRGMDHHLIFTDKDGTTYKCLIEVKNWMHYKYGISDDMFKKEILKRFTKYDFFRRKCWILAINFRNIKYIEDRCKEHNINIVPIDQHITQQYLASYMLTTILVNFIFDFESLLDRIITKDIKWGLLKYIKARWF